MNLVDKLLKADVQKITERPTKEFEVVRLSKLLGAPFMLHLRAVDAERYTEIQQNAVKVSKKGDINGIDAFQMQVQTILAGVTDDLFKNKDVLQKFGVATPKDLINKLFVAGEISEISSEISALTGYNKSQEEIDEEVKN